MPQKKRVGYNLIRKMPKIPRLSRVSLYLRWKHSIYYTKKVQNLPFLHFCSFVIFLTFQLQKNQFFQPLLSVLIQMLYNRGWKSAKSLILLAKNWYFSGISNSGFFAKLLQKLIISSILADIVL